MKNVFRSLPARIVAFVFAAIVLTSLTVMGLSVNSIDSFLRAEINEKFPVVLNAKAERLLEWYDQRERELEVFSQSAVLVGNVPALADPAGSKRRRRATDEIEQYMRYVLDGFPQYTALFILDPDGEVRLRVGAPIELGEEARQRLSAVTSIGVGDILRRGSRGMQIVSAPLGDSANAEMHGTLHAVFDVTSLQSELALDDMAVRGQVLIVDHEGAVVQASSQREPGLPYAGPLPGDDDAVVVEDYEQSYGERFVGGALAFERFGWTLVVEEPYDEAFAPVVGALRNVLLINLAIVLVVSVVTFRIAVSIIRPIEDLSQAARRISDGEKDVEIPATDSADEVGVLTRAFSAMTLRLTRNAAALESSHTALESANTRLQDRNEELHRVNEVLEQLSITDGLTKLHNHRHFQEELMQECKRAERSSRPLSLILVDVDRFKRWNDRLGHAAGDEILRRMADILTGAIRDTDTLARYGGEEFGLIAPNTDLDGARALAEKIRVTIAETAFFIEPPSEREPVTVSVGVALYTGDRVRLFNDADRALYHAKESGRDCVMTTEDVG